MKIRVELQFAYQNYIESEKTIVDAIQDASNAGDWAKVAELTGLKSSDPYMELFKNAKVETLYDHGFIEFSFLDVDASKQSLVKSIIQSDCKDIGHHWIIQHFSSFGSASSSSSSEVPFSSSAVFSSSSEEPSSSSVVFSSSSEVPSSSSVIVMSSASEAVFNDGHLDFLLEFDNFSKSALSTADTTIWKASEDYLKVQNDELTTFISSLESALQDQDYVLESKSRSTIIYQLDTSDYTYRVEIKTEPSARGTNVLISAQKIKV